MGWQHGINVDEKAIGVGVRLFGAVVEKYFAAVAADEG